MALGDLPLEAAVLAKCPRALADHRPAARPRRASSGAGAQLMPEGGYGALVLSLLVSSPVFSLAGAIGAALTAGCGAAGCCSRCWCCPLFVPVVIFRGRAR